MYYLKSQLCKSVHQISIFISRCSISVYVLKLYYVYLYSIFVTILVICGSFKYFGVNLNISGATLHVQIFFFVVHIYTVARINIGQVSSNFEKICDFILWYSPLTLMIFRLPNTHYVYNYFKRSHSNSYTFPCENQAIKLSQNIETGMK